MKTATVIPMMPEPSAREIIEKIERGAQKPKRIKRPGTKGYKWTPQQRARFLATAKRKRRERRAAFAGTKHGGPEAARAVERYTAAIAVRIGKTASAERSDAIVYLRAATERIAHASNAELLALLALRRLLGEIK